MRILKISVYLFMLLLVIQACGGDASSQTQVNTAPAKKEKTKTKKDTKKASVKRILFFGNSLTAAYNLDIADGFVNIIQQKIDSLGLNYKAINAGLSGETSAGGNGRIEWILDRQAPDIFVLELGANDGLRGLELNSTKENLQAIIDKVRAKNPEVKILIAGMEAPPNMGKEFTQQFRSIFPTLAKANQAALIPFLLENVGGIPSLNLPDGIHPNVEGQKIVAENVWKILKEML